jgi:hypothetical protein
MRDVVERRHHVVDRHDVHPTALQAHHREPGRQPLAQALDGLEEVVGAVDLVHLAGLRVAHHHGRAVHRPGPAAFLAQHALGLVLAAEVGVIERPGLVEHVLAEHALVEPGGGDRADVVHMPGLHRLRELHEVARALHIGAHLALGVGLQVVDRGQMKHMVDPALERLQRRRIEAESRLLDVAPERLHATRRGAPVGHQRRQLVAAGFAHQHLNRAAAPLQQALDEAPSDEAGRAGDEVMHRGLRRGLSRARSSAPWRLGVSAQTRSPDPQKPLFFIEERHYKSACQRERPCL